MTKRHDIAYEVAHDLKALEGYLDDTVERAANLMARLMRARTEAGLGINVGAPAVTKLAAAMTTLGEAREEMGEVHRELAVVGRALGAGRSVMAVGGDKNPMSSSTQPDLQAVA